MIRLAAAAIVLVLILPATTHATLHRGFALIWPDGAWDFSDSVLVTPPAGDLWWVVIRKSTESASTASRVDPYYFTTNSPAKITFALQDSTYDALTTAPSDTTLYHNTAEMLYDAVYVVRTTEAHYAKVRIKEVASWLTIEYTYQDNGTYVLAEPVAVQPTTWGRVKSLYR